MDHCNSLFSLVFLSLLVSSLHLNVDDDGVDDVPFWQNYGLPWGSAHVQLLDQNKQLQLSLDQNTGSAAFESLQKYGSGWFNMRIKMPHKDSTAIITSFYLQSDNKEGHDEIDFELLGGSGTGDQQRPYLLHTNVHINGEGGREQQFLFWFDPTSDFHNYTLLWNAHQLVFYVDDIPIRVFRNTTKYGGSYPTQAMNVIGSLWNGTWASGAADVNWNYGPFEANYRGFGITACQTFNTNDPECHDPSKYWWNEQKYWTLDPAQRPQYHQVRTKYLHYDYCSKTHAPECQHNPN